MSSKAHKPDKNGAETNRFYRFRLFVAGEEPNSFKAREVLARLCDTRLKDRCEMQIVDVLQDYQAAIANQVVVVPTLIVDAPLPAKTIVGSLADEEKVLAVLGLTGKGGAHEPPQSFLQ